MMSEVPKGSRAKQIFEEVQAMAGTKIDRAIVLASRLHEHQKRKGSEVPYLSHLLSVAALVQEAGGDEETVIGALLHDSVEDQKADYADIERVFGSRVAEIVRGCTDVLAEDSSEEERTPENSLRRKKEYLKRLETENRVDVLRVSLADKLHNARSILSDYRSVGDALWERFNVGKDGQLWYYRDLVRIFSSKFPDDPQARELSATVSRLVALTAVAAARTSSTSGVQIPATEDAHAEFVRVSYKVIGIVLCITIVLAPLGILLIREGKRRSERIRAEAAQQRNILMGVDGAIALGIASSWDDLD